MEKVVMLIVLSVAMLGIFVFLYNQGFMISKAISAVAFVGSAKGNSAKVTSCTGYIKRVIRFKADGTYTFALDAELSKGDMSVEILDSTKQKIMQLNCSNQEASITVEKNRKYYLLINFKSATGRYVIVQE